MKKVTIGDSLGVAWKNCLKYGLLSYAVYLCVGILCLPFLFMTSGSLMEFVSIIQPQNEMLMNADSLTQLKEIFSGMMPVLIAFLALISLGATMLMMLIVNHMHHNESLLGIKKIFITYRETLLKVAAITLVALMGLIYLVVQLSSNPLLAVVFFVAVFILIGGLQISIVIQDMKISNISEPFFHFVLKRSWRFARAYLLIFLIIFALGMALGLAIVVFGLLGPMLQENLSPTLFGVFTIVWTVANVIFNIALTGYIQGFTLHKMITESLKN